MIDPRCNSNVYYFRDGRRAGRDFSQGGCWALRDKWGDLLDTDKYRHDLFDRFGLREEADEISRIVEGL